MQNTPKLRHVLVSEHLRNRILGEDEWTEGMKIPSERDLMVVFHVSRNTIRRTISTLIREGYLFSEVGRGTFVNSREYWGQKEVASKSKLIGLFITDVKFNFGKQIVRGVEDGLHKRGYSLVLCQDHGSIEKSLRYVDALLANRIQGIILDPILTDSYFEHNATILSLFERENLPVVLVDRWIPGANRSTITTNNEEIVFKATTLLLQNGHQNMLVIRDEGSIFVERLEGVRRAYRERNISFEHCRDVVLHSHDDLSRDTQILATNLRNCSNYTAVLSLNEYLGKVCFRSFSRLGIAVPEDVSFITFDHPEDSSFEEGTLTFVEQPLIRMGKLAAEVMVNMIEKQDNCVAEHRVKSKLVRGRSVRKL